MSDDIITGAQIQSEMLDAKKRMDAKKHRETYNRLAYYRPSDPAAAFHASHAKERMLVAGSQQGKTFAISRELSMHACNRYPKDWKGRRFDTPKPGVERGQNTFLAWVGSTTGATTRAGAQQRLLGDIETVGMRGTEALPASSIISVHKARGIAGLVDYVVVKRDPTVLPNGEVIEMGTATIRFLSYEMDTQAWQAASVDYVWLDEQPSDFNKYLEAFARTLAVRGVVAVSLTPLLGPDALIARYADETEQRKTFRMMINSPGMHHISPEDVAARIADYENDKTMTESEKQCRLYGVPSMAEGAVYTTPISQILFNQGDLFEAVNKPWIQVWGGMDFNHMGVSDQSSPAAFVILSRDMNDGIVRVVDCWRVHKESIATQIQTIREHRIGARIRWHWPRDGASGSGDEDGTGIKERFRKGGIYMYGQHARTVTGDIRRETGIGMVRELILDQHFFVARHLTDWQQEYMNYRYDKGKVVQHFSDLLDATRVAVVDMRYARTLREYDDMRYGANDFRVPRKVQIADGVSEKHFGLD